MAQTKGDKAVGINLGIAPCLESGSNVTNFGIGAKFQYNVTNPVRLEADLDYWFKDKATDVFDISANIQYIFHIGSKVNVYPFVGLGYAHIGFSWSLDDDDLLYYTRSSNLEVSTSLNRFLFNLGVGAEYKVASNVYAQFELRYQYLKDFNRLPINVGITYRF